MHHLQVESQSLVLSCGCIPFKRLHYQTTDRPKSERSTGQNTRLTPLPFKPTLSCYYQESLMNTQSARSRDSVIPIRNYRAYLVVRSVKKEVQQGPHPSDSSVIHPSIQYPSLPALVHVVAGDRCPRWFTDCLSSHLIHIFVVGGHPIYR